MSVKVCSRCIGLTKNNQQCKNKTCKSQKCWIHLKKDDKLRIMKSRIPGAGDGLFATEDFEQGDEIGVYDGHISRKEIKGPYVYEINDHKFVDGKDTNSSAVRYANDCRLPNRARGYCRGNNADLDVREVGQIGILKANKPIRANQEIYTMYGQDYWDEYGGKQKQQKQNQVKRKRASKRKVPYHPMKTRQRKQPQKQQPQVEQKEREEKEEVDYERKYDSDNDEKTINPQNMDMIDLMDEKDSEDVIQSSKQSMLNKLKSLDSNKWVIDMVIDEYFKILKKEYMQKPGRKLKIHFYDTGFYTKLFEHDQSLKIQETVRQYARKSHTPFLYDKIFVPINVNNNHWLLAVIDINKKLISVYDSLPTVGDTRCRKIINNLMVWVMKWVPIPAQRMAVNQWQGVCVDAPQQNNLNDCGVFTMKYADHILEGKDKPEDMKFSAKDMPRFRSEIKTKLRQEIERLYPN